jgi:hypothetical protein
MPHPKAAPKSNQNFKQVYGEKKTVTNATLTKLWALLDRALRIVN